MPKYELMYILASSISDDQVPEVTKQILTFVEDFGGTNITEQQLGKKKLAYPIKKTRNGNYVVVNFDMEGKKVNEFDAKIRTQENTIIRYILVNLEEHFARLEKDTVAQSKLIRTPQASEETTPVEVPETTVEREVPKSTVSDEVIDEKIEAALNEEIK